MGIETLIWEAQNLTNIMKRVLFLSYIFVSYIFLHFTDKLGRKYNLKIKMDFIIMKKKFYRKSIEKVLPI
jgi:hypothetical protein